MLLHYLRAALASLRLSKQTTLINIVGLTLGLTCFILAYVLSAYQASADSHHARSSRIYVVQQRTVAPGEDSAKAFLPSASPSLANYLRSDLPELETARVVDDFLRVEAGDRSFTLGVDFADPELLRIFDFAFVAGDPGSALDDPSSVIVTRRIAEMVFGTSDAIGKTFTIGKQIGRTRDVIVRGVVEESDRLSTIPFPSQRSGILVNMTLRDQLVVAGLVASTAADQPDDWSNDDLSVMNLVLLPADGSLAPDELDRRLMALRDRVVPKGAETVSFRVRHVSRFFDDQLSAALGVLGIVSSIQGRTLTFLPGLLILAMACFNYTNLMAAIAVTRAKEVGMSKVLGASSRQVVQQHLFEALASVALAYALAFVLVPVLLGAVNSAFGFAIPFVSLLDPPFWLTSAFIVLATSFVAGAYPAWVMSRFRPLDSLRIGSKRSGSSLPRSVFIGIQFAVASVLLTAVLVMYAQNGALRAEIARLPSAPFVQLGNDLNETPDVDPEVLRAALLEAPQIRSVTGMSDLVWTSSLATDLYSRSGHGVDSPVGLRKRSISYDFFSTLGVELVAGREFARGRDRVRRPDASGGEAQTGTLSVVLEAAAARALGWSNPADAVGATFYERAELAAGVGSASTVALEVIGVVDKAPLQGLSPPGIANVYVLDPYNSRLILRLDPDDVPGALAHVRAVWERLLPENPLRNVAFVDEMLEQALFMLNVFTSGLLTIVAFGFLVALAGIFGMALFVASRRRHEIGIRKSLGAGTPQILRQLLTEFGRPVLIGNVIAWPISYSLAEIYVDLFVERTPLTPWPYALSLALTLGLAWLGVGGQALRAARLQPARVLRYE